MVDGGYNVAVWSSSVRIRCWISAFVTLYTKVQPSTAILAQGIDGEDIAWVGGGVLVAETLGQEDILRSCSPTTFP